MDDTSRETRAHHDLAVEHQISIRLQVAIRTQMLLYLDGPAILTVYRGVNTPTQRIFAAHEKIRARLLTFL